MYVLKSLWQYLHFDITYANKFTMTAFSGLCRDFQVFWLTNNYFNCFRRHIDRRYHYNEVTMTTMASQITSLTVVYSTVYSDADQRKHQSSASLASVWGIHRDRWIPRTKGQFSGKCFHLMTSSCLARYPILLPGADRHFVIGNGVETKT